MIIIPSVKPLSNDKSRKKTKFLRQRAAESSRLHVVICTCGKYKVTDAEVLIDAAIPVLTLRRNGKALAAFFNVPPMLVREDQLHERLGYGKDGISELIDRATAEVMRRMSDAEVASSEGRLIAYHSKNGADVVIVTNPEEETVLTPVVTVRKQKGRQKIVSSDKPFRLLEDTRDRFRARVRLEPEETAVLVLGELGKKGFPVMESRCPS